VPLPNDLESVPRASTLRDFDASGLRRFGASAHLGKARKRNAWQGKARKDKAKQGKAWQD
jgi:hypothetical protein